MWQYELTRTTIRSPAGGVPKKFNVKRQRELIARNRVRAMEAAANSAALRVCLELARSVRERMPP